MGVPRPIRGTAVISEDGRYRYDLTRTWGDGPRVCFVMLNPSTADATEDDRTIGRCVGFAASWGLDGLVVVNLFAYRAMRAIALLQVDDPVGPENDAYIAQAHQSSAFTVVAWGAHAAIAGRDRAVVELLNGELKCVGTTKDGSPRHLLYARGSLAPVAWPAL